MAKTHPELAASEEKIIRPAVINSTRGNPADEQISYLAAYELVKNKLPAKIKKQLNLA